LVPSAGKNHIIEQACGYYKTEWVPEYAREYLQKKWDKTSKYVLLMICCRLLAKQIRNENTSIANKYLFLIQIY
jgi:hypothetical protein